jgi:hypothetical protein
MVEKNTQQVVCMEYDSDPGSRICFRTWKREERHFSFKLKKMKLSDSFPSSNTVSLPWQACISVTCKAMTVSGHVSYVSKTQL